ncbi:MAG: sigma factor-like helix-turn-helix DNA-binding protein [Candidatus Saccharibacteria bacterium]|nr:sigma factor-like helix-turn-helix DNA-binding protein [Candidatus Saccharibacteria bacterium]
MDYAETIREAINNSLAIIEQEREKEIISRRYGLNGHKETLEQIGEMLTITRERVRQLEKAILIRLRIAAEENRISKLAPAEKIMIRNLTEMGRVARTSELAKKILGRNANETEKAQFNFIAEISPSLTVVNENDKYHNSIGIAEYGDEKTIRNKIDEITNIIKANKQAMSLDELDAKLDYEHPSYIEAIASLSKQLSSLNGQWGLSKWPTVNPKNIRDKIYVVLEENKEPMHFSAIAEAISKSDFRRKNVTVQAIHNELIKDQRFVLIGRGIYALDSWGYEKGTVSDIITRILKEAGSEGLSRKEIVKQVLRRRKVKETTVLLNLQNKQLYKRVGRDHFTNV